jgi:hypothetical protein
MDILLLLITMLIFIGAVQGRQSSPLFLKKKRERKKEEIEKQREQEKKRENGKREIFKNNCYINFINLWINNKQLVPLTVVA